MESKRTKDAIKIYPSHLGFIDNKKDPLHQMINIGQRFLQDIELEKQLEVDGLSIDSGDTGLPFNTYFVEFTDFATIDKIHVILYNNAKLCETEREFLENRISGFDFVEAITPYGLYGGVPNPSGIPGSGIIGLEYGFDWDDPTTYIIPSGSPYVYAYDDITTSPELLDYTNVFQSFDTVGFDEYINFTTELAGTGNLPTGVLPTDTVKVTYLKNDVVSDLTITDVGNLQNPRDPESDGIEVATQQYTVTGNRVVFASIRSDYVPALATVVAGNTVYTYPKDYQPDSDFSSVFIAEYTYKRKEYPRYLAGYERIGNCIKKIKPDASF